MHHVTILVNQYSLKTHKLTAPGQRMSGANSGRSRPNIISQTNIEAVSEDLEITVNSSLFCITWTHTKPILDFGNPFVEFLVFGLRLEHFTHPSIFPSRVLQII